MNKEQYVKKILKHIMAPGKTKARIRADILSGIESKEEQGLTMEEIVSQMGSPREVAEDFNQNDPESAGRRKRRRIAAVSVVFAALSAICLAVGAVGRRLYLGGKGLAHIGGADRPTNIRVVSEPVSPLIVYECLIKAAVLFLIIAAACALFLLVRHRRNGRK